MFAYISFCVFCLLPSIFAIDPSSWQPIGSEDIFKEIDNASPQTVYGDLQNNVLKGTSDGCEVYKVGFTQDLYFQYVQYKTHIPEMKEFTLCFWTKFTNHSNDHPLFSYAVDSQPRAIYAWISNTDRSSYFSMAVAGHTLYRLNYPLRLNRWYHTCQSWNGKSGEWQIWVNAERVGRGFHNRLVGHKIPDGGIAISGQEQTQLGGGFQEGPEAPKGSGGMLGEITMVQLYSIALTAGKAHKDHKHHHAHQFDKNGVPITTARPTTPAPRSSLPTHPLLTSGQLNPGVRINLAGPQSQQPQPVVVPGQRFNAQYLNGQFVGNLVSQQFIARASQQQQQQPEVLSQQFILSPAPSEPVDVEPKQQIVSVPQQVPEDLTDSLSDIAASGASSYSSQSFSLGQTPLLGTKIVHSAGIAAAQNVGDDVKIYKRDTNSALKQVRTRRELVLAGGSLIDGTGEIFSQGLLDGLAGIGQNQPVIQEQKQKDEREPAEAEVKAVMNICSGCEEEPFEKALVFGWRTVPKKLYSGAYYIVAKPACKSF